MKQMLVSKFGMSKQRSGSTKKVRSAAIELDIFIAGESMDLRIPTREFAATSDWYSWFNDPQLNRYMDQGLFPNDAASQVEFFESQKHSRLLLIISNKSDRNIVATFDEEFIK